MTDDSGGSVGRQRRHLQAVPARRAAGRVVKHGLPRVVEPIGTAAGAVVVALYRLRAMLAELDECLPVDTVLVQTPLGIICAPDQPRCVAVTVRGARCGNHVFHAPAWSGGVLRMLDEYPAGFPDQLCHVHRRKPPGRMVPVEWFLVAESGTWPELLYL